MILTVVIPTYNRRLKLEATLDAVLACETTGLDTVEVIVVDDGSPISAEPVVAARSPSPPFTLRCIRQPNAGPAKARNTGFRASRGDIVLFMDDDILPSPPLLREHVAAHQERPGTVIFGRYPHVEKEPLTPFQLHIQSRNQHVPVSASEHTFIPSHIVASGHISVERTTFDIEKGVYLDTLATPVAEEFELSLRLRQLGVPILIAPWIVAGHDHAVVIDAACRQQYTHGVGCAEAAVKCPGTLELPDLQRVIADNGPISRVDTLGQVTKKLIKRLATPRLVRTTLLKVVQIAEFACPFRAILAPMYNAAISAYFCAGVRDGLKKYASSMK
jgi:glycosyltransferase involved in cell wall biosynthesis